MSLSADDRPLAPWGKRGVCVTSTRQLGEYFEFTVADPHGAHLRPGQFHMVAVHQRWGSSPSGRPFLPRALSYLGSSGIEISFLLHDVGPGTNLLSQVEIGEEIELLGPLGNGFSDPDPAKTPVLVGGGIGAAPVLALSDQLRGDQIDHHLILGFRDKSFAAPFSAWQNALITTDDGSVGKQGTVLSPLEELVQAEEEIEIYACGPPRMLDGVLDLANERGITAHLALETPMACGYGSCFGCVVETKAGYQRACVDGPVFEASDLVSVDGGGAQHG